MCGRFSFSPLARIIEERFDVRVDRAAYRPRYNCAPSQELAVITNEEPGLLSWYRWGLIPFWAKDPAIGNRMINAKAETITGKPSFRNAFRARRCLVPADGFYEWKKTNGNAKTPFRIQMKDGSLFSMAGIWERWRSPEGQTVHSFAIITTEPNALMEGIHNRMPVILLPGDEKAWLSGNDEAGLIRLLAPCPDDLMEAFPVSGMVNNPSNDLPSLLEPVSG
ncbi:MAG: SOS response-associated peptidase [Bacteroidales bacterium]|nr:SOS response-associated peptidase [Bacteroidales bacterium]